MLTAQEGEVIWDAADEDKKTQGREPTQLPTVAALADNSPPLADLIMIPALGWDHILKEAGRPPSAATAA